MARVPGARQQVERAWEILRRQRHVVMATVGICLFVAIIYLFATTRLYRATAKFSAEPAGARQSDSTGALPQNGNFLRTQGERIVSRSILALALANPNLKEFQTFRGARNRLNALREALTIDVGRVDDTVSVSVDSPYSDEAAPIANAVVEAYKNYQSRPAQSTATDVVSLYQGHTDKLHKDLDTTTAKMRAIEQQYGVLSSSGDSNNINLRRLGTISQELTTAQFETLKARADFDEASKALPKDASPSDKIPAGQPLIVSAGQEEALRAQLIDLEARREAMHQRYLPGHPALLAITRQIADMNRQYVAAIGARWRLTQKRELDLEGTFNAQQKQIIALSAEAAEYERLGADADRYRKLIDNLESRVQAIQVTRESAGVDVDFFDPADSVVQSHPRILETLSMTLLLGLMLGVGAAFVRESMDDHVHSTDAVGAAAGLPVLGVVPQMPWVTSLAVAAQKVALDPSSDVAEAYRSIRSALDAGAPKNRNRTIVVTAPDSGDGTTTSVANLAIAMAQAGKRVLMIDAALRDPMLHVVFKVSPHTGLSTLLSGQITDPEKVIRKTMVGGLWVIAGGLAPSDATALLNSTALPELLEQLSDKYDHIIIDAPPVADLPDARIIAASCDLTLLVVRADTATRKRTAAARDGLVGVGAHLLGLILTRGQRETQQSSDVRGGLRKQRLLDEESEEDMMDVGATPT